MKNKEKYAKEILEIACSGDSIAVMKKSGSVVSCNGTKCSLCLFCDGDCSKEKIREWAESEYIEKPVISKNDRTFLDYLRDRWKYMARDNISNIVYVFTEIPEKSEVGHLLTRAKQEEFLVTSTLIFQWLNGQTKNRGLSRT